MTEFLNSANNPEWLILGAFGLSLAPILFGVGTSYLKISIVLGMVRSGLGTQQMPGNMVISAISFVLTIYLMGPLIKESGRNIIDAKIQFGRAATTEELIKLRQAMEPWIGFLRKHCGDTELLALAKLRPNNHANRVAPEEPSHNQTDLQSIPVSTLLLSFILTELKEAFSMGFVLLLPFLVIDLIVSNVLVGMGMMMVSPSIISLPLKLILFVASDGWILLTKGLLTSYV